MRIRTVKPEFWQDERLAALPAFARLLAIALLNAADDDGRFRADTRLLAGALFPFEERAVEQIASGLAALSGIGYVVLYEADGRECGWIPGFKRHQRVCRPTPSTIPPFNEASTSARGMLNEGSLRERKGREGNGMEGNGTPLPPMGGGDADAEQEQESQPVASEAHAQSATEPARHCEIAPLKPSEAIAAGDRAPEGPQSRNPQSLDWETAANRFWVAYPAAGKRNGRTPVLSAFREAVEVRKADPAEIVSVAEAYAAAVARWPAEDRRFIPSAVTWLAEDRWTSDPESWRRDGPRPRMHAPDALDGFAAAAEAIRARGGRL